GLGDGAGDRRVHGGRGPRHRRHPACLHRHGGRARARPAATAPRRDPLPGPPVAWRSAASRRATGGRGGGAAAGPARVRGRLAAGRGAFRIRGTARRRRGGGGPGATHGPGAVSSDVRPVDRLIAAYNVLLAIVWGSVIGRADYAAPIALAHVVAVSLPWLLGRSGGRSRFLATLHDVYPLLLMLAFW